MDTLANEVKESFNYYQEQAYAHASQILEHLAYSSASLNNLTYEGKVALDVLVQRTHPNFEEFGIVQLDTYKFQSIFPSKLTAWSRNHESLKDAYDFIHEKVGKVKILIHVQN
jgi:hypothetical protein